MGHEFKAECPDGPGPSFWWGCSQVSARLWPCQRHLGLVGPPPRWLAPQGWQGGGRPLHRLFVLTVCSLGRPSRVSHLTCLKKQLGPFKYCERWWCWAGRWTGHRQTDVHLSTKETLGKSRTGTVGWLKSVSHHWRYTDRCWRTENVGGEGDRLDLNPSSAPG